MYSSLSACQNNKLGVLYFTFSNSLKPKQKIIKLCKKYLKHSKFSNAEEKFSYSEIMIQDFQMMNSKKELLHKTVFE